MRKQRIIVTGGGTGGHVYPALAVLDELASEPQVERLLYIGVSGHLEERIAQEKGLEFVGLKSTGWPRKLSWQLWQWPFQFLGCFWQSCQIIKRFRPTAVLGTGGYASAPVLAAALAMKIPYVLHEPDAQPGLANRVFANQAALVSLGMEGAWKKSLTTGKPQIVVNGNPVRTAFLNPLTKEAACAVLGLDKDLPTAIVTGGSQGAQSINEVLLSVLPALLASKPPIQIIHQVGDKNFRAFKERLAPEVAQNQRYHLRPYFDDLAIAYAASDLAVGRAGAMTISELAVMGKPALFIPFPFAAANHQMQNAKYLLASGAAALLPQAELTEALFKKELLRLLQSPATLSAMSKQMRTMGHPDAAKQLARQLLQISSSQKK